MSDLQANMTGPRGGEPQSAGSARLALSANGTSCRVRIGPVAVEIHSDWPEAVRDFRRLYQGGDVDERADLPLIRMAVRRSGGSRWHGARYTIYGDGEALFPNLSADEVLPYLEWGVNYRFIATQRGYLQLHAAALGYAGNGVLLVGRSGSGKSTLAAALAAQGWPYYSDEFGLIGARDLRLHAFPKALCVKAGSFALVEGLGLPLMRRRPYVKAFKGKVGYVRPDQVSVARDPVRIRLIVFPSYSGAVRTTYHAVSRSQAVFSLAADAFNRVVFEDRLLGMLGVVVEGARCLVLELGDLGEAADLLTEQLAAGARTSTGRRSGERNRIDEGNASRPVAVP